MGSPLLTINQLSHIMSALNFIAPILDLAQNDFVSRRWKRRPSCSTTTPTSPSTWCPPSSGEACSSSPCSPFSSSLQPSPADMEPLQPSTEPLPQHMEPQSTDRTRATRTSELCSPTCWTPTQLHLSLS